MIYSIGYDWSKGMDQTMISVSIAPRITVYCRKYYIILISALFKCLIQHVNFVLYCIVCCLYGNCMVTMVSDNLLLLSFPPPILMWYLNRLEPTFMFIWIHLLTFNPCQRRRSDEVIVFRIKWWLGTLAGI